MGAGRAAFLHFTHKTGTSPEWSAAFFLADALGEGRGGSFTHTHKYPALCSRCLFALHRGYCKHRKRSLLNPAC